MPELPQRLRKYLIGPRIIKTGIAIFVSEILFYAIGQADYAPFAATSAIVAVHPSLAGSFEQLKKSLTANLLAAAIALMVGIVWGANSPLALTLSAVLVLWVLVRLHLAEQGGGVSVTLIWMLSRAPGAIGGYVVGRVGAIAMGTLIGYLVNRFIMRPNFLPKIREGLKETVEMTAVFGERVAGVLTNPEAYEKAEIKAEINGIRKRLEIIQEKLKWQIETGSPESDYLPLEKTKAALFVYVTELARIHKAALRTGGFPAGRVADTVVKAVLASVTNLRGVCLPLVDGQAPDPHTRIAYLQAMDELHQLVEELVDDRATRDLGLACHRVHTSLRHTGRRMRICRETYAQALEPLPAAQGKPVF
jgi:uncharacterized membrane protein YgaE (UPF0421/DUF939 family)